MPSRVSRVSPGRSWRASTRARRPMPTTASCCCRRCSAPGPTRSWTATRRRLSSRFAQRIEDYARKALREAKRHTSWVNVYEPYEAATFAFIGRLLQPGGGFLDAFRPLARRLAYQGMLTGLARTVLKCTVPGVPDVYQGTEFWDLSLVDPDNRRPVDYGARAAALDEPLDWGALLEGWRDGRIKQAVLAGLLADRAAAPDVYAKADYRPLAPEGAQDPAPRRLRAHPWSRAPRRRRAPPPRPAPPRRGPSPRTRLLGRHDPAGSRRSLARRPYRRGICLPERAAKGSPSGNCSPTYPLPS